MSTHTSIERPEPIATAMLEQLSDLDARNLSPETAESILALRFTLPQQDRLHDLSARARHAQLTPSEQAELDEFLRVADLLAILQSRARQALKRTRQGGTGWA